MIEVRGLTRRFGATLALDDVHFRLERGEVVGFLGPNGAGKTTTMRILTGYLPATRGSVTVAGFDVLRDSLEVRRRIGYLAESVPLYREHRVQELLDFQGRLHGMSRRDIRQRSREVLERVGLLDRARTQVGDLSRGLRQRAGLAVALLARPEVLILDEPTSGLDPLQRIEVRHLIRDLAKEHTVLLSSHILAEIEAVCPRVIILARGRVVADGTREALGRSHGSNPHVRVEVVADPELAKRLFAQLPGVSAVHVDGREGMHQVLRVEGEGDLREDVGALCAAKGWALRELSWQRPSLERLFAKVALGEEEPPRQAAASSPLPASPSAAPLAASDPSAVPLTVLFPVPGSRPSPSNPGPLPAEPAPSGAASPPPPPPASEAAGKAPPSMRTLNPFEGFGSGLRSAPPRSPEGPEVAP